MAESFRYLVLLWISMAAPSIRHVSSSSSLYTSTCRLQPYPFIHDLSLHCSYDTFSPSLPIEMDGESLDRYLNSTPTNTYSAVLFHASWCPFSRSMIPKFAALSSMFPQVTHITIEQSAAMPILFSRYGVHSLPSMIILNETAQVHYHEQKDLPSLVHFYKQTTGYDPIVNLNENDTGSPNEIDHRVLEPWKWNSMEGILSREPYLVFSVIFLFFRAVMYFFPKEISNIIEMWYATIPRLNLRIFGEWRQLLGRALDLIDLKRMWRKLKLGKTNGARNAHVWASSSLASVSLGKRFMSDES